MADEFIAPLIAGFAGFFVAIVPIWINNNYFKRDKKNTIKKALYGEIVYTYVSLQKLLNFTKKVGYARGPEYAAGVIRRWIRLDYYDKLFLDPLFHTLDEAPPIMHLYSSWSDLGDNTLADTAQLVAACTKPSVAVDQNLECEEQMRYILRRLTRSIDVTKDALKSDPRFDTKLLNEVIKLQKDAISQPEYREYRENLEKLIKT